jgi:hypothetical protein
MCAIIGSFSKTRLGDLYELNSYRGKLTYSLCSITKDTGIIDRLIRQKGELTPATLYYAGEPEAYTLGHTQAPTTEASGIHPAEIRNDLLWHNGIVKQSGLEPGAWDTEWLLNGILEGGWDFLTTVNGSFACVAYISGSFFIFRNEIAPLFMNHEFDISSTPTDGFGSLPPNTVFHLDFVKKEIISVATFSTADNPYFLD